MFNSSQVVAQGQTCDDSSTRIDLFAKNTYLQEHDKLLNSCNVDTNSKNLAKNDSSCCQNQKKIPKPISSYRLKRIDDLKLTCDYDVLNKFFIWQREYTQPTACGMVFCRGNCRNGNSPCPSYDYRIVFFSELIGYLNGKPPCFIYPINDLNLIDKSLVLK